MAAQPERSRILASLRCNIDPRHGLNFLSTAQAETNRMMNDIDPTLKGPTLSSVYLAADGSGTSGVPRNDDPERSGLELDDMLEMGLESLLMHFRRKPEDKVMADDRTKTGQPDRIRINVEEDYERRDWAKKFGVSEQRLREAVRKVGPMAQKVAEELNKAV
jgi:hypothetical protein